MNLAQHLLTALLKLYQLAISPVLTALLSPAGACRFTPTCSAYALEAVQSQGALVGVWLTARRLARCHPWGGCGHDPVPLRAAHSRCAAHSAAAASAKGLL